MTDTSSLAGNLGRGAAQVGGTTVSNPNLLRSPASGTFDAGSPVRVFGGGALSCQGIDGVVVTGLATTAGIAGQDVLVQTSGLLTLTAAQWLAIIDDGGVNGQTLPLFPGVNYYVSGTNPGMITPSPPPTGVVLVDHNEGLQALTAQIMIGQATTPTTMLINIQYSTNGDNVSTFKTNDFVSSSDTFNLDQLAARAIVTPGYVTEDLSEQWISPGEDAIPGAALYVKHSDGKIYNGLATALASSSLMGLSSDGNFVSNPESPFSLSQIVQSGLLTLTLARWNAVTGAEAGGLVAGSYYYLSDATPGKLTTTAPVTTGHFVIRVGLAITPTTMSVQIGFPVVNAG